MKIKLWFLSSLLLKNMLCYFMLLDKISHSIPGGLGINDIYLAGLKFRGIHLLLPACHIRLHVQFETMVSFQILIIYSFYLKFT